MTDERLAEIRARSEAATPGPWEQNQFRGNQLGIFHEELLLSIVACRVAENGEGYLPLRANDATFIAHSRQDVGDLLAEVERLRQELADTRAMKEHMASAVLEGLKGTTHPDDTDGVMCFAWTAEHIRERVATLEAEAKRLIAELAKVDAWSQQHLRNHAEVVAENERLRADCAAFRELHDRVVRLFGLDPAQPHQAISWMVQELIRENERLRAGRDNAVSDLGAWMEYAGTLYGLLGSRAADAPPRPDGR